MEPILPPYLIESVESACRRKAASVTTEMKRGVGSLAGVSATAVLLGLLGTTWGIMNSFHNITGSKSTGMGDVAEALGKSLVTTVVSLCVGVLALCAYRYLSGCVANFQREMESQCTDLINKLILHLRRSGNTQPLFFGEQSKQFLRAPRSLAGFAESTTHVPLLQWDRMYRLGLRELFWPRLQSGFDAEDALRRGMWITFVSGALSCWLYSREPITAAILGSFFLLAGRGVRRGSLFETAGLFVTLFSFAAWQSTLLFGLPFSAFLWSLTAVCLTGSLRAAWVISHNGNFVSVAEPVRRRTRLSNALFVCLGLAFFAHPFPSSGPFWERDEISSLCYMEPRLYAYDQIISLKSNWLGGPHRGSVVAFFQPASGVTAARVVGIAGDRIQVKAGKLIRNGKLVDEPYCRIPYTAKLGDFPLPPQAFPPSLTRDLVEASYGNTLVEGKPFVVPEGKYFVLNDNRNGLHDSRHLGPLTRDVIIGTVIFAYGADNRRRWPLKFIP